MSLIPNPIFPNSNPNEASGYRARYWVFTLNNYTPEDELYLLDLVYDPSNPIVYVKYGREVGSQGTPHLQGQLECSEQIRFGPLNELFQYRAWLAPRRGTFEQADEYLSKDGYTEQAGVRVSKGKGSRSDLEDIRELCLQNTPLVEIADQHFGTFVRYHRGIEKYRNLLLATRTWKPDVSVFWGRTGTGKTKKVFDTEHPQNIYVHTGESWFDGYHGQPVVLFDEFHGGMFKLAYLLQLLDRYPMRVPIKGSFINFIPTRIYITSNIDPRSWYPNANSEHVAALFRRIDRIVHFDAILEHDSS